MRLVGPLGPLAVALSFSVLSILTGLAPGGGVARAADARAEELYRAGQKAAAAEDWSTACTDFRESEAREHAPGTVLNLAVCEEKLGQLVQAKEHFSIAAREFRRGDARTGYATQRAAALDLRIPRLTLNMGEPLPADATLERDGAPMDLSPLRKAGPAGLTVPLDPGVHLLVVRAAKHADAHVEVKLAEGAREQVALAVGPLTRGDGAPSASPLAPGAALAPVTPAAPPAFTTTSIVAAGATTSSSAAPSDGGSSLRALGIASTVIGGAGLTFGLVAGAVTVSKKSTADDNCSSTTCNATGASAESSGKTWSAVSTVGVVAGAAILATGITLIVVSPRDTDRPVASGLRLTRVGVAPASGGASLGLAGSF